MAYQVVLLDACVLYPAPLRDFLMRLSTEGVLQPRWTEIILEEWVRNLLKARPDLSEKRLNRTRSLMLAYQPDALVTNFEFLIPSLTLPDPDDRHVLAAAIHGGCEAIVTFNLRDFPSATLAIHQLVAIHPDEFILGCLREHSSQIVTALRNQHRSLTSPPVSLNQLMDTLERCSLTQTIRQLRKLI